MARARDDRTAFRCSVAQENSAAKLKIGSILSDVNVLDTSRNGFTVRVPNKLAKKLSDRRKYELHFSGETWEVQRISSFSESDSSSHVGFSRIRDLTKLNQMGMSWWPQVRMLNSQADPAFLMFLMIAILVICVALPGIGDKLGTAPKFRDGIHTILDVLQSFIR